MYVSLFAAAAEAMRRILAGLVNGLLKDFLSLNTLSIGTSHESL